jgi:hypothetical protein
VVYDHGNVRVSWDPAGGVLYQSSNLRDWSPSSLRNAVAAPAPSPGYMFFKLLTQ